MFRAVLRKSHSDEPTRVPKETQPPIRGATVRVRRISSGSIHPPTSPCFADDRSFPPSSFLRAQSPAALLLCAERAFPGRFSTDRIARRLLPDFFCRCRSQREYIPPVQLWRRNRAF